MEENSIIKTAKAIRSTFHSWMNKKSVPKNETKDVYDKFGEIKDYFDPNERDVIESTLSKSRITTEVREEICEKLEKGIKLIIDSAKNGTLDDLLKSINKNNQKAKGKEEEESDEDSNEENDEENEGENEEENEEEDEEGNEEENKSNNGNENNDRDKTININEHTIDKVLCQKQAEYDTNIIQYKHSENNPMLYIHKTKNGYKGHYPKYNKHSKKLEEICDIMKKITVNDIQNKNRVYIDVKIFKNYENLCVSYIYNDIELFDIRHIIYALGLKDGSDVFSAKKKNIKYFTTTLNNFGGYEFRYLIELCDIKMLLSASRSSNKRQIAKILEIDVYDICVIDKENTCLNYIRDIFNGIEMIPQYTCGSYKIDMFIPKYSIAIECDEFNHKYRDTNYEKIREEYIKNALNCTFVRFNPDQINFDIKKVCNVIMNCIINHHEANNAFKLRNRNYDCIIEREKRLIEEIKRDVEINKQNTERDINKQNTERDIQLSKDKVAITELEYKRLYAEHNIKIN